MKSLPKDVRMTAIYIVRGQPRRKQKYKQAQEEILAGSGVSFVDVGGTSGQRCYLPGGKGSTGDPTANKAAALDALEEKDFVLVMRQVDAAADLIGRDLPDLVKKTLRDAILTSCQRGREFPFERMNVPGFTKSSFYRRRDDFLADVAERLGLMG